jgi:hypothetical protein
MSEKVISRHQAVEMRCPLLLRLYCKTLIETIDEHQERSPLDRATSLNSQIEHYRRARATRAPAIRNQDKDSHRPEIVRYRDVNSAIDLAKYDVERADNRGDVSEHMSAGKEFHGRQMRK